MALADGARPAGRCVLIDLEEVRSFTDFQRHVKDYVKHLKETRSPLVLTIKGKAALIVQDVESYQEMVQRIDRMEAVEAIRRAMEEFERGEGRPAREAFEELRQKHDIPR
jgi:PHD/YefM family antitoxin component YafN of YafNO toxin-antitoxin module